MSIPKPLTKSNAIALGRQIAEDTASPTDIAGIFSAILESHDPEATQEILRSLILGIALVEPEARRSLDRFTSEVSALYTIRRPAVQPVPSDRTPFKRTRRL
jgi:hypothetical protein